MSRALIPGSFDPVTRGHLDVIRRAAAIFDEVYAVVFINSAKKTLFSEAQRLEMLRRACAGLPHVTVDCSAGLVPDYAAAHGIHTLVKGTRGTTDYDYEYQLALIMRSYRADLDTLFLPARAEFMHISSTMVRERLRYGQSVDDVMPEAAADYVKYCFMNEPTVKKV